MARWLSWLGKRDETQQREALRRRVREVAHNLLTLEINTVVKHNMTARKMPPVPIALLEIAAKYYWYMVGLNQTWQVPEVDDCLAGLEPALRRNNPQTFDALREASTCLMDVIREAPKPTPEEEDRLASEYVILDRIYFKTSLLPRMVQQMAADNPEPDLLWNGTREQLLNIYDTAAAVNVSLQQLSFIRKAWEIGTETIVLQSMLQLDGDIVTSIQKGYVDAQHKALHDMHLGATRLSIETWEIIVRLVVDLLAEVSSSFSRLLTGR